MTPTPNNMNTPSPEVFQPADTGRMRAWPFVLLALGLLILVAIVPYIEVERLTEHYGVQFEDGYKELGYFKECDYHKVLRYEGEGPYVYSSSSFATGMLEYLDDDEAAVLYVVDGHAAELLVVFEQAQDGWKMKSWDAIWSKSGSADDFTPEFCTEIDYVRDTYTAYKARLGHSDGIHPTAYGYAKYYLPPVAEKVAEILIHE